MTPDEFLQLPIEEKVTLTLADGAELLERIYMYFVIKLYTVQGLYVEIWYQQLSRKIDKVQLVELEEVIHLYEGQINISDIFS